ncbi:MAG: F0F1 ATP synthase subunit A [Vulcanimicrobiaceae bacterium]
MHEKIGEHLLWHWPVIGTVHVDTVLTTWIVMAISFAFFGWVGSSYTTHRVNKVQAVFEEVIHFLSDIAIGTLGRKGERMVPAFVGIFVFVFLLNQVGFFPFKQVGLPFGGSPTADLNSSAAFALIVFLSIQFLAIRQSGIKAYSHLFKPFWVLFPINLIEETVRPIVLCLRLFFNIFVGELLLFVVSVIILSDVAIGPVRLSFVATVIPFLIQFFNFFVGTIQAFVFTLLAIVYTSLATAEEH